MRANIVARILVPLSFSALAYAQGLGTISGGVTDQSGGVIESAGVTVTEVATGLSRNTLTTQEGYYVLNSLRPTEYAVAVEKAGFEKFRQTGITLLANQSLTLNLHLKVGSANESVTVHADATQVDTTTQTLRQVVDASRMVELPLNGRNAAQLTTLVAGAVIAPSNNADQGPTKTFPAAVTVSTNGSRQNQISYILDGVPNIDVFSNVNQPFPFPDALQEFSVQTSNYNAEFGQNAGGVVSIVTKSGTNGFHGNGFGFLRNSVLNARNFFAASRDPLKRAQYGGTLGGPVIKDRTFFFVGYQGTRIRSNMGGLSAFVPTNDNLNGDFSAYLQANNPNNSLNKIILVKDPLTGQPFPDNIIPASRLDPASLAVTKYLPREAGAGHSFFSRPIIQNYDEYIIRGDHSLTSKDRLAGRYYWDRYDGAATFGGNLLAYKDGSVITSQNAALQETHLFGPSLLNDIRFGFSRVFSNRHPPLDTPSVRDFGVPIFQAPDKQIQSLAVSGYFSTGDLPTAQFPRTTFSWTDDVRWVHGRHNIAFGGLIERDRFNMTNVLGMPGTFSFSGDTTGSALADFMLGRLRTFGQAFGQHLKSRYLVMNVYAQDTFRVSNRLTLNFGLRYEPSQVWHDAFHQAEIFRADLWAQGIRSKTFPNAPPGLLFSGDAGVPEYGVAGDLNNVAPRLGFAWDVFGNGKTSLRGGGGFFYDSRVTGMANNRELGVSPYSTAVTLTTPAGPFSNPYLGIPNPFPAQFPPTSDAVFPSPVQVMSWDPYSKLTTPVNYNYNLTVEQELKHDWLARVAYVGSRANHMTETLEYNPATYTPGSALGTDQRRRYPGFSNIYQGSQAGNSWYQSAQFTLQKRFTRGFTIMANYTFSKSLDNLPLRTDAVTFGTSGWHVLPTYVQNFKMLDYGRSDFDRRHVFVTSYVWQLPSLAKTSRLMRGVAGGWELSGVVSAQSGGPLTIEAGKDQSQTGINYDRAVLVSQQALGSGACTSAPCVNYLIPSAFALPATGGFGNVGKGLLDGPGVFNWDMSVSKGFQIAERLNVRLRGEFFNTFNRLNANNPVTTVAAAGFGSILGASDPRIVQVALKVTF